MSAAEANPSIATIGEDFARTASGQMDRAFRHFLRGPKVAPSVNSFG
ncbi:MAG: hypothetical protein L6Q92_03535 [Phycisphaerae bacterium]|nr:hypothetical protein [Phycisphaerae bacterium]